MRVSRPRATGIVELLTYDVLSPFDSDLRDQLLKTLAAHG
jgi:hypothetical protein